MNFKKSFRNLGIVTSLSFGFLVSDAYAYIDPGSGSMIIQMLIGVLVGESAQSSDRGLQITPNNH